jgi:hypothetical protein
MVREHELTEDDIVSRSGIADSRFADHSGDIQHGYQLGSLTEGLVAYYPMEEGQGQVLHDGALDNVGTINGATWNGSGQVGSDSLSFDGTNDYASLGDKSRTAFTNFTNQLRGTISAWINPSAVDSFREIVGSSRFSTTVGISLKIRDGGNIQFVIAQGVDGDYITTLTATNVVTESEGWVLITATINSDESRIYKNGNSVDSESVSGGTNSEFTSNVSIGRNDNQGDSHFNGLIDGVRIYDRALSQPEVEALYNLTSTQGQLVQEKDLVTQQAPPSFRNLEDTVARYEFENDVTDSWGDNDGTDTTSATYAANAVYGTSKDFDNSSGASVDIGPNVIDLKNKDSMTISAWVSFQLLGDDETIFANWGGTTNQFLLYYSSGSDQIQLFASTQFGSVSTSYDPVETDTWYHLVGDFDAESGVITLYVNGQKVSTAFWSGVWSDSDDNWLIGNRHDDRPHYGQIDDLRIYNRSLDPIEIEALFNKGAYRIDRGEL